MKVEIEVSKESYELAKCLAGIVKVIAEQGKDGFQVTDVAPIVAELFTAFSGEGMKGVSEIPAEIKAHPVAFAGSLVAALEQVGLVK
jgi:hypothetical protein